MWCGYKDKIVNLSNVNMIRRTSNGEYKGNYTISFYSTPNNVCIEIFFFDVESERDEHYERIFSMLTGTKWEK